MEVLSLDRQGTSAGRESERRPLTAGAGGCQGVERAAQVAAKLSKENTSGFSNAHSFCFLFLAPT